jgi:hypothetical protein
LEEAEGCHSNLSISQTLQLQSLLGSEEMTHKLNDEEGLQVSHPEKNQQQDADKESNNTGYENVYAIVNDT